MGEGLREHLPLLSLALELAQEGPGQWTQQERRLPSLSPQADGKARNPKTPEGDSFGLPEGLGLFSLPLWSWEEAST